jgi:hypothetical protein
MSLIISPSFVEIVLADQAIVASGVITVAHGLGLKPKIVIPFLVNQTAEFGWVVGEETPLVFGDIASGQCYGLKWDNTNINMKVGVGLVVGRYDTGSAVGVTLANWKVRFKAYF